MSKAPGKASREGLTLLQIADMFGTEEKAREWIEQRRWPNGPVCPKCGTSEIQCNIKHPTMTHRCRKCPGKPMFSMKTGTVMEGSKIKHRHWAVGIYLFTTNIKGISSMRLHRELGIGQKAAWFMLHRLRDAFENETEQFVGPVEVDEKYMGGNRSNMSNTKRKELREVGLGRGTDGKTAVVGMRDQDTNKVRAKAVEATDKKTLRPFAKDNAGKKVAVYTDDAAVYDSLLVTHESIKYSVSEYVKNMAHTNGIRPLWSLLKRGYNGIYHKMFGKHFERYVNEFAGRYNDRAFDTIDQMSRIVRGMQGKRIRYDDLIANNDLSNGARS
ncbi:MAG: IS1595 family transposase [Gammaproteobacteria bacterium]|nr:IS1595 family transposase [Gammaproteobacteria bacterium]MYD75551.1 IS1595 family transposase [Gammaproteobacteria bacterium]MYJ53196.1 IS1595 family transposase [Gammaproteobacteria bacterium]